MYQITIIKTREYTEEEKKQIKEARNPYMACSDRTINIDTKEQVLSTELDAEQFKAVQKAVLETFK